MFTCAEDQAIEDASFRAKEQTRKAGVAARELKARTKIETGYRARALIQLQNGGGSSS